jgi:hypothetical protein
MDLPQPRWLFLQEALGLTWSLLGDGPVLDEAKTQDLFEAIARAAHDGDIRSRGRCKEYFDHEEIVCLPGAVWDRAEISRRRSAIRTPRNHLGMNIWYVFTDVSLAAADVVQWASPAKRRLPQGLAHVTPAVVPDPAEEADETRAASEDSVVSARERRALEAEKRKEGYIRCARELYGDQVRAARENGRSPPDPNVSELARAIARETGGVVGTVKRALTKELICQGVTKPKVGAK